MFDKIRRDRQINPKKRFPPLWMWQGDIDTERMKWAAHTAECFADLQIETDFIVNFSRQKHEIIRAEAAYLKEWVEKVIPNPEEEIQLLL